MFRFEEPTYLYLLLLLPFLAVFYLYSNYRRRKNMIVYHYCSLESLNSILKNRSLRLTNILKSNDSMEISWICRYYDAEFKRAYENASDLFRSKNSSER